MVLSGRHIQIEFRRRGVVAGKKKIFFDHLTGHN
jgi:hypothetical protein